MRIVIAGPPKTGNMWLKCLLGRAYGLRWLRNFETPERPDLRALTTWLTANRFADGTIFHQHYDYAPEVADALATVPAHVVTIVRDPYDAFVSTYYTLQQHSAENNQKGRKFTELMGKPLNDPAVIDFLRRGGYRNNLEKARDWANSGRAVVLRYENLSQDPLAELRRATEMIAPVSVESLETAIDYCSADRMRQRTKGGSKHVRAATVGDSERQLTADHLEAFREAYAEIIAELGYSVR
ncbi:MAG TPA: sulfotransferase domain-containing protein [Thermomicrobiales bacterium]|nr:sulfotransferase domain-containing protein [Thermomicrobiales bacterium]